METSVEGGCVLYRVSYERKKELIVYEYEYYNKRTMILGLRNNLLRVAQRILICLLKDPNYNRNSWPNTISISSISSSTRSVAFVCRI